MDIVVSPESPLSDEAALLFAGSQRAMEAVFPPEEIFTVFPEEMTGAGRFFYVARRGGRALGCVAAVDRDGYTEVKRLFVAPEGRGLGVGRALMRALETQAQARHMARVRLETGPVLLAAVGLYRSLGYVECAAFGGYPDIESNLFMEKTLL